MVGADLGQLVQFAAEGVLLLHDAEDDPEDQQPQVAGADEQVAPPLAPRLHDAQQDRIRGNQTPKIIANAEAYRK